MKRMVFVYFLLLSGATLNVSAQAYEIEQLLLNVKKLEQLKQILSDMKKGYAIVSSGYNTIKNISEGNFSLHKTFLDGLMEVSPVVRNYKRVSDIIHFQVQIVKEYRGAFNRFRKDGKFAPDELKYLAGVYSNLLNQSLKNLSDLSVIITAGGLRMTDNERLAAIDDVFHSMQDKLIFLRHFNNNTVLLTMQRARENKNVGDTRNIYGLTQ